MIQTAEQILENVRALPQTEREKLFQLIEAEKSKTNGKPDIGQKKNEKFQNALKWIDQHRKEFDGQFVLLDGDNLLAHGINPKELYDFARAKGIKSPFVKRIKSEILPFWGW